MPTPTIPLTDIPEEEEPAENPFCPDFISYDKMLDIVESLPEGYCKVFKLAVLEGLSHKEIGDLLGIAHTPLPPNCSGRKFYLKNREQSQRKAKFSLKISRSAS